MLTKADIKAFREKLLAMAAKADEVRVELANEAMQPLGGESGGGISNTPIHPADLGSRASDEQVTLQLLNVEENIEREILDAVSRIDAGKFGVCEKCHGHITKARLEAIPYARHCIQCAKAS